MHIENPLSALPMFECVLPFEKYNLLFFTLEVMHELMVHITGIAEEYCLTNKIYEANKLCRTHPYFIKNQWKNSFVVYTKGSMYAPVVSFITILREKNL